MAVTQNSFTGNGSTTTYSFTFPYLKASEIKASLDGTVTTAFTTPTATTVQFNTAPSSGAKIKIYRETDTDSLAATFYAGSAIKSEDLNDNFTQNLYTTQEVSARYVSNLGGTMVGDLNLAEDVVLTFEGATDNANETTLTVADPTADRTITLPDVTGTVVTTGDTGTVATGMIAADAVTGAKIADDQINSEHYVDGSIDTAHIANSQITTAKIADSNVTTVKIADSNITTAKIADGNITHVKLANDAVDGDNIANDSINSEHYVADSIDSEHYAPGSVDATALASNSVTQVKLADDAVGENELASNAVVTASIVDNAITLAKMADSSVGTSELVNDAVTNAKIANDSIDSEHYVDASIDTAHIGDDQITNAKIATDAVNADSIAANAVTASELADNAVDTAAIADNAVTSAKIAANAVTTTEIADAELTTLAGMQSGTASILAGGTALTATLSEINAVVDGKTVQTTISDTDASYPTSGAVVDYVAAQIAPLGGLEVIANEDSFPTQPASGVVISIADAGGIVINGSGVSTTARTSGNGSDNVTINGFPSTLYSTTLTDTMGLMVSSTGSSNTYTYHKLLGKESDIKSLSDDINDFNNRYRIASSAPSSSLDNGDLWFDTSNAKMMVYNATASAWEEVTSTGDFYINTISSYSGTGGNSATFNGSAYRFTLSNPPQAAQQLIVSVNGVVQKPNSGTGQPSEGFAINGSTIVFSAAPATGADYFIITVGSTVAIGTPSDNTVSTAKIQNLGVTTAKIAADAVDGTKIADDAVGAEHIEVLDAALQLGDNVKVQFGTGNDFDISFNGTNGWIDCNAGSLYTDAEESHFIRVNGNEDAIKAVHNGGVELYYDNSKKLETRSDGVGITGILNMSSHIYLGDSDYLICGASNDLQIFHDGVRSKINNETGHFYIQNSGSNDDSNIYIRARDDEESIVCFDDASVRLYYDGVQKFETTSGGISVTGNVIASNDLEIPNDSGKIKLGTSSDLQIYHSGTHSIIKDAGTGNLQIAGSLVQITNAAITESALVFTEDAGVDLRYDGVKKFETLSAGVGVTGTLDIASGSTVTNTTFHSALGGAGAACQVQNRVSTSVNGGSTWRQGGDSQTVAGGNHAMSIFQKEDAKLRFGTDNTEHFRIESNGDLKGTDTSIGSLSDSRLKKNIADFTYDLNKFKQFKPRTFDWINPKLHGSKSGVRGFIAQEIETVDNALIGNYELYDETETDKNPDLEIIKADDGSNIAKDSKLGTNDAMYVSIIQQLIAKIETLETKVAALEAK